MSNEPCQGEACAIQTCLQRYNYKESKCQNLVDDLYRCCDQMYKNAERKGIKAEDAKSTACPMKSVVDRRMKKT